MRRRSVMLVLTLWTLVFGVAAGTVGAQDAEKVRFTTADGVEIHGTFYPSSKKTSATVMLLHGLGENSLKKEWTSLAEELQKAHFSVLAFDFRGHGNSTEIKDPQKFWTQLHNQRLVKAVNKTTLDAKYFSKAYYPVLANDIAAARAYLERTKNDLGLCNTSSLIVIGADTGATLGALWTHAEWFRFKLLPPDMVMTFVPQPASRPEGKDIICTLWLSIKNQLGTRQVSLNALMDLPGRQQATPTIFMYSEGDATSKAIAKNCEKFLKASKDEKYRLTKAFQIPGNNKLSGSGLLQKSLGTDKAIAEYLEEVVKARGNEWMERDYRRSQYIWRLPGSPQLLPAKLPNDNESFVESYDKFLTR